MAHKRNSVEVPELEKLLAGKKKKYVQARRAQLKVLTCPFARFLTIINLA